MVPRTARRSRSLRHLLGRRGVQVALPLFLSVGGAIIFNSTPASAATTSTDSIIFANGSSQTVVPLPAGTPDVVTPVATALSALCGGPGIATERGYGVWHGQFGPAAGTVVVAAVGSVGVVLPTGLGGRPANCIVVATGGSSAMALAPRGPPCCEPVPALDPGDQRTRDFSTAPLRRERAWLTGSRHEWGTSYRRILGAGPGGSPCHAHATCHTIQLEPLGTRMVHVHGRGVRV